MSGVDDVQRYRSPAAAERIISRTYTAPGAASLTGGREGGEVVAGTDR